MDCDFVLICWHPLCELPHFFEVPRTFVELVSATEKGSKTKDAKALYVCFQHLHLKVRKCNQVPLLKCFCVTHFLL